MINKRQDKPKHYKIIVLGQLSPQWQNWFEELTITFTAEGNTLLSGPLPDQPALYGVLKKINNLGLTLISVNPQPTTE